MMRCFWFVVFFLSKSESKLNSLSINDINVRRSLSDCIIHGVKRYFLDEPLTVMYSMPLVPKNYTPVTLDRFLLPRLNDLKATNILIRNFNLPTKYFIGNELLKKFIIHFRNEDDLFRQFAVLKQTHLFEPFAKYLLFTTTAFSDPFLIAATVSKYLWTENVVNSVILLPDLNNTFVFNVFSWNPFEGGECSKSFNNSTHLIDSCSFGRTKRRAKWFSKKIPKKFSNCEVKVKYTQIPPFFWHAEHTLEYNGVEFNILETIGEKYNITFYYELSLLDQIGDITEDQKLTGVFKFLENKSFDIALGGYPTEFTKSHLLETSMVYTDNSMSWCVPDVPLISDFEYLFRFVDGISMALIVLLIIISSLLVWALSLKNIKEHRFYKSFSRVLFHFQAVTYSGNLPVPPRTNKIRCFVLFYLMFSIFFSINFNSFFISYSSRLTYKRKFTSVDDIYRHKLKMYFFAYSKKFFKAHLDPQHYQRIVDNWKNCTDYHQCLKDVNTNHNSSICISKRFAQWLVNFNHTSDLYCMVKDRIHFSINLVMRKGHPLFQTFDNYLGRMLTAGFVEKWLKDSLRHGINRKTWRRPLGTLKNILPSIELLGIMLLFAFLVFIFECYLGYTRNEILLL